MVVWVQFPALPIHFYHKEVLFMLGNLIGRAIKLDYHTEHQQRARFARIAVEVDLGKPLVPRIWLDGAWQYLEYENLPVVCFECGRIGHTSTTCPSIKSASSPAGIQTLAPDLTSETSPEEKVGFGPWMQVTRRSRRNGRQPEKERASNIQGNSNHGGFHLSPTKNGKGSDPQKDLEKRKETISADSIMRSQRADEPPSKSLEKGNINKGKAKIIPQDSTAKVSKGVLGPAPTLNKAKKVSGPGECSAQQLARPETQIPQPKINPDTVKKPDPSNKPTPTGPTPPSTQTIIGPNSTSIHIVEIPPYQTPPPPAGMSIETPLQRHLGLNIRRGENKIRREEPRFRPLLRPSRFGPRRRRRSVRVESASQLSLSRKLKLGLASQNPKLRDPRQPFLKRPLNQNPSSATTRLNLRRPGFDPPTRLSALFFPFFLMSINHLVNFKVLSWNVGGAGNPHFIRALKLIIQTNQPDFLILLEPQVSGISANRVCGKLGFPHIMRVEADGRRGGIWFCWKSDRFTVELTSACFQHLSVKVSTGFSQPFLITAVYASPRRSLQQHLWNSIQRISETNDLPWLLTGDFNSIRGPEEKSGPASAATLRSCKVFNDRINKAALIDLGFTGPKFTWTRGDQASTYKASRIDRSLCNDGWNILFPDSTVTYLPRIHSDHHPLLTTVTNQGVNQNPSRPFRFEAAWLTSDSFSDFLTGNWNPQIPLPEALESLSERLKLWNRNSFGNIFQKKRRLLKRIQGIQNKASHFFSPGLLKLQAKLEAELDAVLAQEELLWFQRSREQWVHYGERNTAYFHQQASIRKRRNKIGSLKAANGEWISNPDDLAALVFDFFTLLYTQDIADYSDLMPKNAFPRLSQEDLLMLLRPFQGSDIHKAIHEMKALQAPGPDGFQAIFYQKAWRTVGKSLIDMAMDFFSTGTLPDSAVASTVVLIPKVENIEMVSQLRPISLNNVCLKAITKAIANRLKPIMKHLISPRQSSFIPGRQTADNIIVLQEVLHSLRKRKGKKGGVVIKIDLEKAFDRLRWDFLRDTLVQVGLPSTWISCIMYCVEKNNMRLLWNGELSPPITPSRGVRQGDPLSPYLFILCMERLSHRIDQAIRDKLWKPIRLSKDGPALSHLFFADDLVLFAEAESSQIRIVKQCLDEFCQSSGQRVNYNKSAIFVSANIERRRARWLSRRASIPLTVDIGRYLGVNAIHGRVSKARYQELILRIQRKLAPWKAKHLSLAARMTVVKSISTAIPVYPMQMELLPASICKSIDRLNRDFFWGDTEDKKKLHLVSWPHLLEPKENGGAGLRSTRHANLAMLTKGCWRLLNEKDTLWVQLMRSKYGGNRRHIDLVSDALPG
ncbi:unnamed protein product [Linum tenue]|uniref:Reverse transcriptase domain-containing protein n=1 Tax=Linum tenue TaxID=586396 RepID=A0AAV0IG74_9ROSI|nr:unnamed protein product [Linum tenue]